MPDSLPSPASNNPVVLVAGTPTDPFERACLSLGCQIYGFTLRECADDDTIVRECAAAEGKPILVAISAAADRGLATRLAALAARERLVVAVLGLTPETAASVPVALSHGHTVQSFVAASGSSLRCGSQDRKIIGHELAGLEWELMPGVQCQIETAAPARALALIGSDDRTAKPALLRIEGDFVTYFVSGFRPGTAPASGTTSLHRVPFGQLAPYLLLLRDAAGQRCWHAPAAIANLTIDDPRLIEPYGHLSFAGLLAEMNRANFHATIGFVPWNYDRSESAVVELFRANPARLSLAVHGNNHEGYEFFRYVAKAGDTQRSAPFEKQLFNVRQGLARIAEFERRTGLEVGRVMVFPQAISPAPTLEVLRQHGFRATANFSNVPLDAATPDDPTAPLRSALVEWHDLPALRRDYPQEYSEKAVAMDLFLGNPVLFMAHHDDFADGIDAFNAHAVRVNRRGADVRWISLEEISRQLHRLRLVGSRLWEVRMVSCHARIVNPEDGIARFAVRLPRTELRAGTRVTLDGRDQAWEFKDRAIRLEITLPGNGSGLVEIHEPQTPTNDVPIARSGWRKRRLRMIADFRDLVVSRSALGQWLTKFYYRKLRRAPLKSGRGRRRLALMWDSNPGRPRLTAALIADLPPELH